MATFMGHSARVPAGTEALPIWCDVCKARVELVLPVGIEALSVLGKAFEKAHARCGSNDDGEEEGDDYG